MHMLYLLPFLIAKNILFINYDIKPQPTLNLALINEFVGLIRESNTLNEDALAIVNQAIREQANRNETALAEMVQLVRVTRKAEPQKFCGNTLLHVLYLVCDGKFYHGPANPITPAPIEGAPKGESVFQRRSRRGIVDQCCRRACSIAEIRLYCENSN